MFRSGSGPSKASPQTLCQKCLKRDNYECKAVAQERPYVSRPSRSQMLANPKLMPKLTSDVPSDLLRKKGVADEQLAKKELERGRKRERDADGPEHDDSMSKRQRSRSSSVSVSTISTKSSRSGSRSMSPPAKSSRLGQSTAKSPNRGQAKRRRDSVSSAVSYVSSDYPQGGRPGSRSTRRRISDVSPPARGRQRSRRLSDGGSNGRSKSRERSPEGHHQRRRSARMSSESPLRNGDEGAGAERDGQRRLMENTNMRADQGKSSKVMPPDARNSLRGRSLSPFSKRLALTQAMGK